jgi:hypothetical protein
MNLFGSQPMDLPAGTSPGIAGLGKSVGGLPGTVEF